MPAGSDVTLPVARSTMETRRDQAWDAKIWPVDASADRDDDAEGAAIVPGRGHMAAARVCVAYASRAARAPNHARAASAASPPAIRTRRFRVRIMRVIFTLRPPIANVRGTGLSLQVTSGDTRGTTIALRPLVWRHLRLHNPRMTLLPDAR